jgi:hypothetical protein
MKKKRSKGVVIFAVMYLALALLFLIGVIDISNALVSFDKIVNIKGSISLHPQVNLYFNELHLAVVTFVKLIAVYLTGIGIMSILFTLMAGIGFFRLSNRMRRLILFMNSLYIVLIVIVPSFCGGLASLLLHGRGYDNPLLMSLFLVAVIGFFISSTYFFSRAQVKEQFKKVS